MTEQKKRKRSLTIAERYMILERLERGESGTTLAKEFDVSRAAITLIKKRKEDILQAKNVLQSSQGSVNKKRYRGTEDQLLESKLYEWFVQRRSMGLPISGPILQQKALLFNQHFNGSNTFKASNGWLNNLKKRHGIRYLTTQGEKLSADPAASENFKQKIQNIMKVTEISSNQIYNCNETGLYWKIMPNRTFVCRNEKCAEGRKKPKDRVTVMACTNASGNHKIPLFVIGKSAHPRCFKGIKTLSVVYEHQANAWMNQNLMVKWYFSVFVPEGTKEHNLQNMPDKKIILIMDNASCHPPAEILNNICTFCTVIFLPPNVTSLIQPLDQGIIEKFKKNYRKILITRVLAEDTENSENFLKSLNLLHCCTFAGLAWETVSSTDIRNCWKKLIPLENDTASSSGIQSADAIALHLLILQIPLFEELSFEDTVNWLDIDSDEIGWQARTDEEILLGIIINENDTENVMNNLCDEEQEIFDDDNNNTSRIPSPRNALSGLRTYINWHQRSEDASIATLQTLEKCHQSLIEKLIRI